jgi:SAM-dependent methyltransferase
VLEVGCGPGELAERLEGELNADVAAVDLSPRMVELARLRGVDARQGDAQELPFEDASFDCVIAAWMLYHVPDVDRALGEAARVLVSGGRLVAVTNASDHLVEARELVGSTVPAEDAPALLGRHFAAVESRDASGTVTFPDRDSLVAFVDSWRGLTAPREVPADAPFPLVVRRRPVILIATRA